MQQSYQHILTFLFKHRFFTNQLFNPIDISFGEGTAKRMKNLGIIIKLFSGGGHLLASDPELLKAENDINPVRLNLSIKDYRFINYTELPEYSLADKLLYFTNITAGFSMGAQSFVLHEKEFVGQNDIVEISSGIVKIPSFNATSNYYFTDVLGDRLDDQNIVSPTNNSGEFKLLNLSEGLVNLFADGKQVNRFFYNPKQIWKKPLGILELFPDKLFTQFEKAGKVEYLINFNQRETIWKYFFVSPVYHKFKKLSIINKKKEQIFNRPQKQLINENNEVLVFESKSKIPISENANDSFQLVDNFNADLKSGKVILKSLPNASADMLYSDKTRSDEAIYSHIFI